MASLSSATQYTSRPVETVTESGRSRTLQEVLLTLLSDLSGDGASAEARKPESSVASTSQPEETPVDCHFESFLQDMQYCHLNGIGSSDSGAKRQLIRFLGTAGEGRRC